VSALASGHDEAAVVTQREGFRFGVAVLAAGASTRMGKPKMLLAWGGGTILSHALGVWTELQATQTTVVHAETDILIKMELDRLQFPAESRIANPEPARGMFGSILCAAHWRGWRDGLTHWIISLGDQPHLDIATLRNLLAFAAKRPASICQPVFQNRPRHPVILPRRFWCEVAATPFTPTMTLREFLTERTDAVSFLESSDPGLATDIDTPEDYERARQLSATRPS